MVAVSHEQFAEKIGVEVSTVVRWVKGTHRPAMKHRRKLAEILFPIPPHGQQERESFLLELSQDSPAMHVARMPVTLPSEIGVSARGLTRSPYLEGVVLHLETSHSLVYRETMYYPKERLPRGLLALLFGQPKDPTRLEIELVLDGCPTYSVILSSSTPKGRHEFAVEELAGVLTVERLPDNPYSAKRELLLEGQVIFASE